MNYSVGIIAALASITKALDCADSPLRFNINGDKKKCDWEGVACFGEFDSDKFASHCKATCRRGLTYDTLQKCVDRCFDAGHCCGNRLDGVDTESSNQRLSCANGCEMAFYSTHVSQCKEHCNNRNICEYKHPAILEPFQLCYLCDCGEWPEDDACDYGCEQAELFAEFYGNVESCCVDSLMKFKTPDDGYKDCNWVGKKEERCLDATMADTCPVACKRCTQPTLQNLELDIDTLIVENNDLTVEIEILKASQASFCNDLHDHVYIDGAGCFPFVYRDNELKLYVANSLQATWEDHNEVAIACGGNLASVLDEGEAEKIALFDGWWFIGGMQTQPCNDEPAGCWVWSDGNEIGYSGINWGEDEPNDSGGSEDCMVIDAPYDYWNDVNCTDYEDAAIYMLPTNFNSDPNCNILL